MMKESSPKRVAPASARHPGCKVYCNCKIADLIVRVPTAGGLAPRCKEYLTDSSAIPDICIRTERLRLENWPEDQQDMGYYMESGWEFYGNLLRFQGLMLHASAVEYQGKAYLFSGPSTVGKSTHTHLWQAVLGDAVQVFNDDKPAVRYVDGQWFAYGTPWCGKDGINQNKKVPLVGICFLKQAKENRIRRISSAEAVPHIMAQTMNRLAKMSNMELLLSHIDQLVRMIPIYELECLPDAEAAQLCIGAMTGNPEE